MTTQWSAKRPSLDHHHPRLSATPRPEVLQNMQLKARQPADGYSRNRLEPHVVRTRTRSQAAKAPYIRHRAKP